MKKGFIKIHRDLCHWALYKDSRAVHLLIHLLINATHKPIKIKLGSKPCTLQPGQLVTGRLRLSEETGINESKIRRLLQEFEDFGEISRKTTNKFTIITLIKWEQFQINKKNDQRVSQRVSQRVTTQQEDKEDKNNNILNISIKDQIENKAKADRKRLRSKP